MRFVKECLFLPIRFTVDIWIYSLMATLHHLDILFYERDNVDMVSVYQVLPRAVI